MALNIPLGRLAGIKVTTDPTVIVLAAVYTVSLALGRFPDQHPDLAGGVHWAAGVAGALLFFGSLLVHELAHALVAREEGIGVRGISLWFLGGMARLESSPTTAAAEFRIAVVGPLASAACGVTFLCSAYVLPEAGVAGLIGDLFQLLGFINLVLAAFNLLPAAPLDGGTVLASLIWKKTGSQARGMQVAAYVGLAVGTGLVWKGYGIARQGDVSAINGWSLVAVGAFILFAALQSLRARPLYALLDGVVVADAMDPVPPTARASASVAGFLRSVPHDVGAVAFPVVDDRGRLHGLLTGDAIRATDPDLWEQLRVQDLAYPLDRVTVVRHDEPLLPAVQKIDTGDVRDGIVIDGAGRVVGLVDTRALFRMVEARRSELVAAR